MDVKLRRAAERAVGFMPEAEGLALYEAARGVAERGPLLEIGSYCGKSSIYLGAAAREANGVVFSIDHHRGSEEHQPGEAFHDPELVDPESGLVDTLVEFRRTIQMAELTGTVIGIIGDSSRVAAHWRTPLALLFIDGSHSMRAVTLDYEGWAPHVLPGGLLVIHDVFDDPAKGGRPPYEIYRRALRSEAFADVGRRDSLRVLRRIGAGL